MLERLFFLTARLLALIAGTALLVMMVLTFVDVIGRYGFHRSIFGTAEIVEYLMIFTIFAGLAFVTATNDHITVTMFDGWIERWLPNLRRWLVILFSIGCYALVAWHLLMHGYDLWASGKRSAVLDLPLWFMAGAAGALSTLGLVLIILATTKSRGYPEQIRSELSRLEGGGAQPVIGDQRDS
ncbi:MAG: TRAP transporter small permease [Sphingomonadales bacterium]|nr:TRAP transporter small permease [Sphingomonadales bacterium]